MAYIPISNQYIESFSGTINSYFFGGGFGNEFSASTGCCIYAGIENVTQGEYNTIITGSGNTAYGSFNTIINSSDCLFVFATTNRFCAIINSDNSYFDDSGSEHSSMISTSSSYLKNALSSSIVGGAENSMQAINSPDVENCVIAGGENNTIAFFGSANNCFIGGGYNNKISGQSNLMYNSAIIGSKNSTIQSFGSLGECASIIASYGSTIDISGNKNTAIIGCDSMSVSSLNHAVFLGFSSDTIGTKVSNRTYVDSLHIDRVLQMKPRTTVPAASDGLVFYSANTGLMVCVGSTWRLVTAV